jgi:hypothetical protein
MPMQIDLGGLIFGLLATTAFTFPQATADLPIKTKTVTHSDSRSETKLFRGAGVRA